MRKVAHILTLAVWLGTGIPVSSQQYWDPNLAKTLDSLAENAWQGSLTAAFGTFTFAYSDLPSPFSRWVEDELAEAIPRSARLRLFNRAAAAAMDPAFRAVFGAYFRENGVDALLHGRFFAEGETVRLRVELTGLADGVLIGSTDLRIPRSRIPPGVSVDPAKAVVAAASELGALLPAVAPGRLKVSVSTDRGAGAAYREGEKMVVLATVSEDAFVKIYHIDAAGMVQLVWPNRFGGSGRVAAGEVVRIPGPHDPFAFVITPPYGTEFLKIIASQVPYSEQEADFADLGGNARGILSRGLAVTQLVTPGSKGPERAEALASYIILQPGDR